MGQLSTVDLRSALGWTQLDLAREITVSRRTIYRIEKGITTPRANIQRDILRLTAQRAPQCLPPSIRRHVIDPERMRHYLNTALPEWKHWSRKRRGQFRRWRLYYQRIHADVAAGRAYIVYAYRYKAATPQARLARVLDAAPASDT